VTTSDSPGLTSTRLVALIVTALEFWLYSAKVLRNTSRIGIQQTWGRSAYIGGMSMTVRFLGTSAACPTVDRGVSALALVREGETLLFDCGEGTQRQMMRYGVSFGLSRIFFTHTHSDHVLGVTGLLRTMQLQGRTEPMYLYGPRGSSKTLRQCITLGGERIMFPVEVTELAVGEIVRRDDYHVESFPVDHRGASAIGYALVEATRLGRFNPEIARAMGIPEGPMWGQIHRGLPITLEDGRVVNPSELVGAARRGRRVVVTGDTRPCAATVEAAHDADLLVHEATFADEEAARAVETGHSTAREAAEVARLAGARRLVLTHISARYSREAPELEAEARHVFARTQIARDGLEIEVPATEEFAGE
jgi:ribonuclease Z